MKRPLSSILADLDEARASAGVDLNTIPMKFKAARAIEKADAEARLPTLEAEYKQRLYDRVATIFVVGDPNDQVKFAELAEHEGDTLTLNVDEIYEKVAVDVEPSIGALRQFGGTQLNLMIRGLEDVARKAGVGFIPVPRLLDVGTVKTPAETVAFIKDLIGTQVPAELRARYIEARIVEEALADKVGQKIVPVVIFGAGLEEAFDLQPQIFSAKVDGEQIDGTGIVFEVGATVDKDTVIKAFGELREAVAKRIQKQ